MSMFDFDVDNFEIEIPDDKEEKDKIVQFLKEYEKLCQKYDMGLCGCGCCDSPFLTIKDESCELGYRLELGNVNYSEKEGLLYAEDLKLEDAIKKYFS